MKLNFNKENTKITINPTNHHQKMISQQIRHQIVTTQPSKDKENKKPSQIRLFSNKEPRIRTSTNKETRKRKLKLTNKPPSTLSNSFKYLRSNQQIDPFSNHPTKRRRMITRSKSASKSNANNDKQEKDHNENDHNRNKKDDEMKHEIQEKGDDNPLPAPQDPNLTFRQMVELAGKTEPFMKSATGSDLLETLVKMEQILTPDNFQRALGNLKGNQVVQWMEYQARKEKEIRAQEKEMKVKKEMDLQQKVDILQRQMNEQQANRESRTVKYNITIPDSSNTYPKQRKHI